MHTIRVVADESTVELIERRCQGSLRLSGVAHFWEYADVIATVATVAMTVTVDLPATVTNARLLWSCIESRIGGSAGAQGDGEYVLTVSAPGKRASIAQDEPIAGAEELVAFLQRNGLLKEPD